MIKLHYAFLLLLALCLFPSIADAHRDNESYVYLNVGESSFVGRFEIRLSDLGLLLALDDNNDQIVSQGEVEAHQSEIFAFFQPRLRFTFGGVAYPIKITFQEFLELGFSTFAQIRFTTAINTNLPDQVTVEHTSYFQALAPRHRVLLLIESNSKIGLSSNESSHALVFSSGVDRQELSLIGAPWYRVFWTFLKHGVVHILIGYDHIAFLFTLLLSSVMRVRDGVFVPVARFRDALWNVLKIATIFTLAHSLTLSLAALDLVRFPERIIESLIAVSIIIVALTNLFAFKQRWVWLAVFLLGLVHGLGFANVLAPLGVASSSIAWSLVAFNAGVEFGQAAIIAACFPVLFLLRSTWFYSPVILRGGSVALLAVASQWFIERAFQVNVPVTRYLVGLFT